ncbi:MAG TPA: hypothetical protein VI322_01430 [Candidatus Saccharimonadia bacterium]
MNRMSAPAKPKPAPKSRRNQPPVFGEGLMAVPFQPTLALTPTLPVSEQSAARPGQNWARLGLAVIWAAAMMAFGVAFAQLLIPAAPPAVPGAPVAQASLSVAPLTATQLQNSATAINSTLASASYQAAAGVTALQPGYVPSVPLQGQIGTAPVR